MSTLLRGAADHDVDERVAEDDSPSGHAVSVAPRRRAAARAQFPARVADSDWPGTRQTREQILGWLAGPPFTLGTPTLQHRRLRGVTLLLDWLAGRPAR